MRIASGGIRHETNTFSVTPTTLADYVSASGCGPDIDGGEAVFNRYANTNTIHGGYIDGAKSSGFELIPVLEAYAIPSGVINQESFDTLLNRYLERLKNVLPVDGLLLDLHGAMVTEKHEDGEGAFIEATRALVGQDIPIIVTLDLHANITPKMADLANVIIGYDTYPHIDMYDRGYEAATLIAKMVTGEVSAVQEYRQLPLITLPPMQCTLREPMITILKNLHDLEKQEKILTGTISMGFPFADVKDAGVSILVTADGDEALAKQKADELAEMLWSYKDELQPDLTTIEDVIDFVNKEEPSGLTIFADGSDNPGGGGPSDGTIALKAMISADFQGGVVGVMFDPETVNQAHEAGVGNTVNAMIGGKTDDRHGETIEINAYVKTLSDGVFVRRGKMQRGLVENIGKMATLVVGGIEIVLASKRMQLNDAEMLRTAGVEPSHKRLLVVKSAVHFRSDFTDMSSHIFDADTPGIHRPDFDNYEYNVLRRPIYPLDQEVSLFG